MINEAVKDLLKEYAYGLEIMNRAENFLKTLEKEKLTDLEIFVYMNWYYNSTESSEKVLKKLLDIREEYDTIEM